MSRLQFQDRGHRYSLDGEWLPGVTTIVRAALANEAFQYSAAKQAAQWAALNPDQLERLGHEAFTKMATEAYKRNMVEKGNLGTQLHMHAQQLVETGTTDAPPEQVPYVEAAADFLDTHQAQPVASECPIFHDTFLYAGRLDLLASLSGVGDDRGIWLLDFKTGAGVYPDVALQLAGYRFATHLVVNDEDRPMVPVSHAGVVWVRPEGWQLIPVRADRDIWTTFLSCIPLYQFSKAKPDTILGAPMPRPAA